MYLPARSQGPECFFVHFDKPFYAAGETIWFKVYALDLSNEAKSRVLYVDLVNHKNETIDQQKLLVQEGMSSGSITLPIDSDEGYYRFRAFTRYNFNFNPPVIYQANLPIFQVDFGSYSDNSPPEAASAEMPIGLEGISIFTEKDVYQPRDSLSISFQLSQPPNDYQPRSYSISIVPIEYASKNFEFYQQLQCPEISPSASPRLLPERTLFVEGQLRDPESKQNITSRLLSVYVDNTSQLIRASSNNGRIKVGVSDFWGTGVFQILNLDPYNPAIPELVNDTLNVFEKPYYNQSKPPRTARVQRYLQQVSKRRKISELFNTYNPSIIPTSKVVEKVPDAIYRTDSYKQIYSFEQFINEAIPNVKVRLMDGLPSVRLFSRDIGGLFQDHPWYIVDGFITFNEQMVLQIPYQDIIEVRLFTRNSTLQEYFHGFMMRSGVMQITTRDVKYVRELRNSPNVVEMEGFRSSSSFATPSNPTSTAPDFRGVIYWQPEVPVNEKGRGHLTVNLSDDTGKFAIVIMGTNNDQVVTGYHTFEIKH